MKNGNKNRPLISVVVPVYNGGGFLPVCLDALFASDYSFYEVLVIDDGSTDSSAEISRYKGANVWTMTRQSGPGAARNFGSKKAKGDILLFVDADVVVKFDTITKVAADFENHPEISALFGSYDDEPGEKNFLSQYKNLQHHYVHQISNREASTFWAGLGAIRRDVFTSIGGFDCERFQIPSIEDIELGVRLRSAGHRILLDRDIQAKHLKKWEIGSLLRTDIFCRALPWSKLILTSQGLIDDMNLKTSDRLSAILVGLSMLVFPFAFWKPILSILLVILLLIFLFLNRGIFQFFAKKKGILFAARAFPCQLFYFFYSGVIFVLSWVWYALPLWFYSKKRKEIDGTRIAN